MSNFLGMLLKREECKNDDPTIDPCEKYVSNFTKTGIPVVIGLSLFCCAGVVIFIIVRRHRKIEDAAERAKDQTIDDSMELTWVPIPKHGNNSSSIPQGRDGRPDDSMQPPPPSYNQAYPPQTYEKDRGRPAFKDSDYV